jgi:hypothetical protein
VLTVFSIVYATSKLDAVGLPRSVRRSGCLPIRWCNGTVRVGPKPMYIGGAVLAAALAFPIFWLRVSQHVGQT